jgi:hypothetical protein
MNCIQIVDCGKHYENHRTRELKVMTWVPFPNKHDGDGYTQLLDHPNGAAHFGAWCALVEVASRQHVGTTSANPGEKYRDSAKYDASDHPHGRGILIRNAGEPHDPTSLERMTRIPASVWKEALPRLVTIGWIRGYIDIGTTSALDRQDIGGIPREGAGECPMNGMEGNGKTLQSTASSGGEAPPSLAPSVTSDPEIPDDQVPESLQTILAVLKKEFAIGLHISDLALLDQLKSKAYPSAICEQLRRLKMRCVVKNKNPPEAPIHYLHSFMKDWKKTMPREEMNKRSEAKSAEGVVHQRLAGATLHTPTPEDDAEVERLAAETRARLHMVDPPAEIVEEPAVKNELDDIIF